MKAERRHELQHNELADWIAEVAERLRPYTRAIVGVVLAALVLFIVYSWLTARRESSERTAWDEYYDALEVQSSETAIKELHGVVERHGDTTAGSWAKVTLADYQLLEGVDQLFTDKDEGLKKIDQAVEHYEAVAKGATDSLLAARAQFGLARAYEAQGDLEKAREAYQSVVQMDASRAYAVPAEERLEQLKGGSAAEFYAWFKQQEPVPLPPSPPLPGTPGERPAFDPSNLSPSGDVNLSPPNSLLDVPKLTTDSDSGTTKEIATKEDATKEDPAKSDDLTSEKDTNTSSKDSEKTIDGAAPGEDSAKQQDAEKDGFNKTGGEE